MAVVYLSSSNLHPGEKAPGNIAAAGIIPVGERLLVTRTIGGQVLKRELVPRGPEHEAEFAIHSPNGPEARTVETIDAMSVSPGGLVDKVPDGFSAASAEIYQGHKAGWAPELIANRAPVTVLAGAFATLAAGEDFAREAASSLEQLQLGSNPHVGTPES